MSVAVDTGTGIVTGIDGRRTPIAAGSSAAVGPYQVRVFTVDGATARFELSNPDL